MSHQVLSKPSRQQIAQTVYLAISYAVIFTGYYSANAFVSVLYPDVSFIGWALLYTFYAVSSILAPSVGKLLGLRTTITLAAICYVLYIAAVNVGIVALYLSASVMIGMAAGSIWFRQGEWISRMAVLAGPGTEGMITAIFYTVFNFQGIIGNLIGILVLLVGANVYIFIWSMCGLTFVGVILSLFIAPLKVPDLSGDVDEPEKQRAQLPLGKKVLLIFKTAIEPNVLLLWPIIFLQSSQLVFSYQIMPKRVYAAALAYGLNAPLINIYTFLAYWSGSVVSSFLCGRIFDRFGYKAVLIPVVGIEVVAIVSSVLFIYYNLTPYAWIFVGFMRGNSDYGINNLICSEVSLRFKARSTILFGLYRCLYALGFVAFGLVSGLVVSFPYYYIIGITSILLVVGVITFVIFVNRPMSLADLNASSAALNMYLKANNQSQSDVASATSVNSSSANNDIELVQ